MSHTLEIRRELHSQQSKRAIKSRSHIPQTKNILKRILKSYVTSAQIDNIKTSKVAKDLFYERGGWFYDPLLFNMNDCNMRHIRNMRARCSYLKSHSYFMTFLEAKDVIVVENWKVQNTFYCIAQSLTITERAC